MRELTCAEVEVVSGGNWVAEAVAAGATVISGVYVTTQSAVAVVAAGATAAAIMPAVGIGVGILTVAAGVYLFYQAMQSYQAEMEYMMWAAQNGWS